MARDQTSALPDDIQESIAIGIMTSVGEQPTMLANLALANLINNLNLIQQNSASNQQEMNQLLLAVTGKLVNLLANLSPLEAAATGNDTAQLAKLVERSASMKGTQTSLAPPPTDAPTPEGGEAVGGS